MKTKTIFPSLILSLFVPAASQAAVTLTVTPNPGGGIQLVGSGSLNVYSFSYFGDFTISGGSGIFDTSFSISPTGSHELEAWLASPTVSSTNLPGGVIFDTATIAPGTPGLALFTDSFRISSPSGSPVTGIIDDRAEPSQEVFDFDFSLIDNDTEIEEWLDATWTWDSNGTAAGGETVTLVVSPDAVPEPSSALLLGLAGVFRIIRRRRS